MYIRSIKLVLVLNLFIFSCSNTTHKSNVLNRDCNLKTLQVCLGFFSAVSLISSFLFNSNTNLFNSNTNLIYNSTKFRNKDNKIKYDFEFINLLTNNKTKEQLECSPNTYNYLPILLKQLKKIYPIHNKSRLITTDYINNYIVKDKNYMDKTNEGQYLRLKFFNGQIYFSKYQKRLSYRSSWWIYYFARLFEKYGFMVPNSDFIIFMGDTGNIKADYMKFPFFVGDGGEIKKIIFQNKSFFQLPLYTVPRSFFNLNQTPYEGFAEVLCYRNRFKYKNKLNKAIFRGSPTGGNWKISKRGQIIINSTDKNNSNIDAKFTSQKVPRKYYAPHMSTTDQMIYKYILLIDGNSVRDAFPKQLAIGSIILKQVSTYKEFWYYDIKNNSQVIKWIDYDNLSNILNNLILGLNLNATYSLNKLFYTIKKQKQIARNGREFVDNKLNDHCLDCFVIHMIQVYNYYFFNKKSIKLSSCDILINKTSLLKILNKGYYEHIYNFNYNCPISNTNISSQKIV